MTLKVLLLNLPRRGIKKTSTNIAIKTATIEQDPTLHDFHAIIFFMQLYWTPTKFSKVNGG